MITGVRAAEMLSAPSGGSVTVYQAGTSSDDAGALVTSGGRVLDLANPQTRLGAGAVVLGLRSAVAL